MSRQYFEVLIPVNNGLCFSGSKAIDYIIPKPFKFILPKMSL